MGTAFVGLSVLGELPWWVTIVVLVREVGITAMRFVVIRHGVMPASRGGKVKTVLQALAIGLYVLPLSGGWHLAAELVMGAAVIVTVVTGVDYVIRARTLRRTSPRAQAKRARRAAHLGTAEQAAQTPEQADRAHAGAARVSTVDSAVRAASAALVAALTARSRTVATAESLTGGLVSAALTGVPGASAGRPRRRRGLQQRGQGVGARRRRRPAGPVRCGRRRGGRADGGRRAGGHGQRLRAVHHRRRRTRPCRGQAGGPGLRGRGRAGHDPGAGARPERGPGGRSAARRCSPSCGCWGRCWTSLWGKKLTLQRVDAPSGPNRRTGGRDVGAGGYRWAHRSARDAVEEAS